MNKLRVAIVGYGNIGKYAIDAVKTADDMELCGVIRRNVSDADKKMFDSIGVSVSDDIKSFGNVNVAILCTPTRAIEETAKKYLELGISTVDSFDIHSKIVDLRSELDKVAKQGNAVSIISAGWDPGSDSMIRALFEAAAPSGLTYTNFGPGMSMGHSVCAKGVKGVKDALSMTIPLGSSVHRRVVYVELENNSNFNEIVSTIKSDPYFANDETHVMQVENINDVIDMGHGVSMTRKGVSGKTHNQLFNFDMRINNPALTSQIMISAARATMKRTPGAYTLIEIPLIDMLQGDRDSIISRLV